MVHYLIPQLGQAWLNEPNLTQKAADAVALESLITGW